MVARGAAQYARDHERWRLDLVPDWLAQPNRVSRWRGDGIIAQLDSPELLEAVRTCGKPFVNVSDLWADLAGPSILSDNQAIGRMAAEHLLSRGFSNFAFCGLEGAYYSQQRGEGFRSRIREADCQCTWHELNLDQGDHDGRVKRLRAWMAGLPKPLGLLACHDELGRLVAECFMANKFRVPEDLAVVGVDNDEMICHLCPVPLSSVAVDGQRIGYLAARELAKQLAGKPRASKPVLVPPVEVVTRASTEVLAVSDNLVAQVMQYIREHVSERPNVSDIAEKVPVGRRTLEKRFRSVVGRSVLHEIQRTRVEVAKDLLTKTELQMATVAKRAGFLDPRQMWLIFRKYVGSSPSQFRNDRRLH